MWTVERSGIRRGATLQACGLTFWMRASWYLGRSDWTPFQHAMQAHNLTMRAPYRGFIHPLWRRLAAALFDRPVNFKSRAIPPIMTLFGQNFKYISESNVGWQTKDKGL